eukprot:TRINITY_DN3132_c0_g1_i2.p1 TRINITY_DN3132_c0_g1~~TRINITY_DN3132_c0_g1_i2.p1  ORF type:complete len:215 (-),score=54.64 TRINITY_DN3132_c0_g1_i2:143-787(-)
MCANEMAFQTFDVPWPWPSTNDFFPQQAQPYYAGFQQPVPPANPFYGMDPHYAFFSMTPVMIPQQTFGGMIPQQAVAAQQVCFPQGIAVSHSTPMQQEMLGAMIPQQAFGGMIPQQAVAAQQGFFPKGMSASHSTPTPSTQTPSQFDQKDVFEAVEEARKEEPQPLTWKYEMKTTLGAVRLEVKNTFINDAFLVDSEEQVVPPLRRSKSLASVV